MDKLEKTYRSFLAALHYFLDAQKITDRKNLAGDINIGVSRMSQIIKTKTDIKKDRLPDRNRWATFKQQVQIANALGFYYPDFILFGQKILLDDKHHPNGILIQYPRNLQASKDVRILQNKLMRIKRMDPKKLAYITGIIDEALAELNRKRKDNRKQNRLTDKSK
jgi:hypothetical protein